MLPNTPESKAKGLSRVPPPYCIVTTMALSAKNGALQREGKVTLAYLAHTYTLFCAK